MISQTSPNSEDILFFSLHFNNLKVHSLISKESSVFKVDNLRVHVPSVSYNLIMSLKVGESDCHKSLRQHQSCTSSHFVDEQN